MPVNQLTEKIVSLTSELGNALGRLGQYVDTGYDFGQNSGMSTSPGIQQATSDTAYASPDRYMLWVDGVGAYRLCLCDRVTFGGPHREGGPADIALLANLSGRHASVVRNREGYLLEAHAPVRLASRTVDERELLRDGNEIDLGAGVKLRFRLPTVLSMTATVEFLSDHRPAQSIDGVILMDETCLLGPGAENHVRCADWTDTVLLSRRGGELQCKSRKEIFIDGRPHVGMTIVRPGEVVSGADFAFRIEALT